MRASNVSVVPTLKLWRYELNKERVPLSVRDRLVADAQRQLKGFADAGGQVLFGTDVGYMSEFDPTEVHADGGRRADADGDPRIVDHSARGALEG